MPRPRRSVIAHHLILTGYGHWLPNDPRGSGSTQVRKEPLRQLGDLHHGRKNVQPPRSELKHFHHAAEPLLEHEVLWFDNAKRQALTDAFARVIANHRYTCYACAVLRNHAHLCIRRHRDSGRRIWTRLAQDATTGLRLFADIPQDHPIWSKRPYIVFLYTPSDIQRTIRYIAHNLTKHRLDPPLSTPFVKTYDNWPHPPPNPPPT